MMRQFGQEIHATLNDELCPGEGDAWQDAQCGEGDAEGSEDEEGHETWDLIFLCLLTHFLLTGGEAAAPAADWGELTTDVGYGCHCSLRNNSL